MKDIIWKGVNQKKMWIKSESKPLSDFYIHSHYTTEWYGQSYLPQLSIK